MKTPRIAGLVVWAVLAGGCAGPGVLRPLPDPVFLTPRPQPAPPVEVTPPPPLLPREGALRRMRAATIVVDAGHGGDDPGARGLAPVAEETINLNIALELARSLEERGARVITSRDRDFFVSLDDRAALAERTRADLLVSIHADSSQRSGVSGSTVYIARSASTASHDAARCIVAALERAGIECRGISNADYRVLAAHSRPAVLVECGFLTNRSEAQRLSTPAYQAQIAAAIADGIVDHFSR